jgi:hypothetical protein
MALPLRAGRTLAFRLRFEGDAGEDINTFGNCTTFKN